MIKNSAQFIVFEGLDGSGQSTQARLLSDYLKEKGCSVVLTKEPTEISPVSSLIKKALTGERKVEPAKLQELFAQDRAFHLEQVIRPALKQGQSVISDRYYFSSLAYGALALDWDYLLKLNQSFDQPDLVFFLEVEPRVCLERIKKRGQAIKLFETREQLKKIWQNYQLVIEQFKEKVNLHLINGQVSIEEVFKQIKTIIDQFL